MKQIARATMIAIVLTLGIGSAQGPWQRPGGSPWQQQQHPGAVMVMAVVQFLGVTPPELILLSGGEKSLAQIAKDLGKDAVQLEAVLVQARNQGIDQAVQAGRMTAEQAAGLKGSSAAAVKVLVQQPLKFGLRGQGRPGR